MTFFAIFYADRELVEWKVEDQEAEVQEGRRELRAPIGTTGWLGGAAD